MSEQLCQETTSGGFLLRRPRDSKSFREFDIVRKFKLSEKNVEKIDLKGDLRVALIFPNSYNVLSSSLGFNIVWKLFNKIENVRCERFFYHDDFVKFYSIDSLTPLDEFPIWAFAVNFENDLLNIISILKKKSVPIRNIDRRPFDPLVVFGGALTYTKLPVFDIIADVILHGDFEPMVENLDSVLEYISREKLVEKMAELHFASVPVLRKKESEISKISDLNLTIPASPIIFSHGEFKNRLLIEIERGCVWNCNFCMMGALRKPARFLNIETLKRLIMHTETCSVGLIASNVTDYPWLEEMLSWLEKNSIKVSVSSLRLDRLSKRFVSFLKRSQHAFTIAPESASEKIRKILGKNFTDQQIESALVVASEAGFREVKMYFMYGFDEEEESDLKKIGWFVRKAKRMGYRVKISANPFIPKRGTFMQNRKMQDLRVLKEKEKIIKNTVQHDASVVFENIDLSFIQYTINSAEGDMLHELIQNFENGEKLKFIVQKLAFK